jgi:hypothetical protein
MIRRVPAGWSATSAAVWPAEWSAVRPAASAAEGRVTVYAPRYNRDDLTGTRRQDRLEGARSTSPDPGHAPIKDELLRPRRQRRRIRPSKRRADAGTRRSCNQGRTSGGNPRADGCPRPEGTRGRTTTEGPAIARRP